MRKILMFFAVVLVTVSVAFAQTRQVQGTVTSAEDGSGVPGVMIQVKGTTVGVMTDSDGKYTLNVPAGTNTLVFSFVGMKRVELDIAGRSTVDVVMESDTQVMDEIVVTALGIRTEKKALGYSTSEVKSDALTATKTNNFATALSGKVAGLNISTTSSQAGSGTRIVLRGGSSITGSNEPLFVVNGVPFDADNAGSSSGLADIDPNAIESLSVLKGAAASALYGSRAANGVILITLKSGSSDSKPTVTFKHTSTFDRIYEIPLQKTWAQGNFSTSTYDWVYINGDTQYSSTSWGPRISELDGVEYYDRWQIFDTGYTMDNTVSVTGGTDKSTYFVSYSNTNNDGVVGPLGYQRNSVNANTTFKFTPRLTVSSNVMYSNQDIDRMEEGNANYTFMNTLMAAPPSWNPYPIFREDGTLRLFRGGGRDPYLYTLQSTGNNIRRDRFVGSASVEFKIAEHLNFRSVTGISTNNAVSQNYKNKGGLVETQGVYNRNNRGSKDFESTEMITYDNTFGDFTVNVMAGHNIVQNYWDGMSFAGSGLVVPGIYNTSNVSTYTSDAYYGMFRSWSLFGEARIGYKSMLYYTVTGRNDWASSINNDYFYPSHSLGFIFSELMKDATFLDFGKVRLSYAKVGAPASAYTTNIILEQASGQDWLGHSWPFSGQNSYLPSSTYPNPDLANEFKSEIEAGLELKFFKNRLGIDLALYNNWSTNQILWQQLLNSTGYSGGWINIGGISHKGIELGITSTPVQTKNITWDFSVTWAKDVSRVDDLGENDEPIDLGSGGWAIVGQPYPVLYGDAFLRDDEGNLVLSDQGSTGQNRTTYARPMIDPRGRKIFGKISPDWVSSIRNSLSYKNFSLMAQVDIQKGGLIDNFDEHYLTYYGVSSLQENRPEDNRIVFDGVMGHYDYDNQQVVVTNPTNTEWTYYSSYYQTVCQSTEEDNIQPRDFIKLREVSLTYRMPSKVSDALHLKGLDLSLSGRNLWRKFKDGFSGPDVETNTNGVSNGNAWFNYSFPSLRTYTVTLNITL
jgi:TonB-linked SusC/RagA family outer membrane protein